MNVLVHAEEEENGEKLRVELPPKGHRRNYLHGRGKQIECKICQKTFSTKNLYILHKKHHNGDWSHHCTTCNKVFESDIHLKAHIKKHKKKIRNVHVCQFCGKQYRSVFNLRFHENEHLGILFECHICHKQFSNDEYLTGTHMLVHSREKYFVCDFCGKSFSYRNILYQHISRHLGLQLYRCGTCNKEFPNQSVYLKHKDRCGNKNVVTRKYIYKCIVCGREMANRKYFKIHRLRHLGQRDFPCHLCSKQFVCVEDKVKHVKMFHEKHGAFTCPICHKTVNCKRVHMLTHSKKKTLQCDSCDKSFSTRVALKDHILKNHIPENKKDFQCTICGNEYFLKKDLSRHMGYHKLQKLKKYKCTICDKALVTQMGLSMHMMVHRGEKPVKCEVCDATFRKKDHLKTHMIKHTKEKKYKCDECGQTFGYPNSLKRHLRVHAGIFPYACSFCGKKFVDGGDMKRHVRLHTGVKPYKCGTCGEGFSLKDAYKRHLKSHEEPVPCPECKELVPAKKWKQHIGFHDRTKWERVRCPHCPKTYCINKHLEKHINKKHSEVKTEVESG